MSQMLRNRISYLADGSKRVLNSRLVTVVPSATVLNMLSMDRVLREDLPYLEVAEWTSRATQTTCLARFSRGISGPERHGFVALPESQR